MSTQTGKLGVCLSGGGFRAALFHIGALAALAERGLLHQVQVLSTVSGGSIIGAYYYLKVKQLLEGKRPGYPKPEPGHYLDIVKEIERDFLTAVQKNIRMRLFFNPYKTAKTLLEEEYSRSDRLSELLDAYFYESIALTEGIRLNDIHIIPPGAERDPKFSVESYNATATCKIPVLTINATCLNTGHPWHFTGSWMGEPSRKIKYRDIESLYELEQDTTYVLPQLRFDGCYQDDRSRKVETKQLESMRKISLSDAVAASAAVPGIFPPLPIHGLYHNSRGDEIVVELSDGGIFDNQGLDALFAAQCTDIIVSDACGQLEDERLLPTDLVQVAQRASNVMQERIRDYGYFDLWLRHEVFQNQTKLNPLRPNICFVESNAFAHLREQAPNTTGLPALPGPANKHDGAVYRLSSVRTDLDSFSDMEACTLMYQGYSLALDKLRNSGMGTPSTTPLQPWRFLGIKEVITNDLWRLTNHLKVGKKQFFKTFYLAPVESWIWLLFLLSPLITAVILWLYNNWSTDLQLPQQTFKAKDIFWSSAVTILALLPISPKVREWFKTNLILRKVKKNPASDIAAAIVGVGVMALAVFASVVVFIHLNVFNPIYLKKGRLRQ